MLDGEEEEVKLPQAAGVTIPGWCREINMRKKRSPIWLCSKEKLVEIYKNSASVKEALGKFGLPHIGCNYKTLKARLDQEGMDYSRLTKSGLSNMHIKFKGLMRARPLKDVLIENIVLNTTNLKARLIKERILKNVCSVCNNGSMWQGAPIALILDHISGDRSDNRIENLRLVCPNCSSQLPTFAGRNISKRKKIFYCSRCNEETATHTKTGLCAKCRTKLIKIRPERERVVVVLERNRTKTDSALELKVSRTTLSRWIKLYNIPG